MTVKINTLEIENTKRIKSVVLTPDPSGLTVIGGKNGNGKTSVLDSIAWALGGDAYRPDEAKRRDSVLPPHINIRLSNGIVVERKGKNSDLKVTDPSGKRAGQKLLNSFIDQLALDLPKFMNASDKEKAHALLNIIGVEDELNRLRNTEKKLTNERLYIGQEAKSKEGAAKELPYYKDAPDEMISASALIQEQQAILARNGENQKKRQDLATLQSREKELYKAIEKAEKELSEMKSNLGSVQVGIKNSQKTVEQLKDESTAELAENLANIENINTQVRANYDKERAEDEAKVYRDKYKEKSAEIEKTREAITNLLKGADLPLPELSVNDSGSLTYKGYTWSNLSSSEQLKVGTAIARAFNPKCGFVLLDKLEQMDTDTLQEFGEWLQSEGLQAIATRVSTGDECSVIITDGTYIPPEEPEPEWEAEDEEW